MHEAASSCLYRRARLHQIVRLVTICTCKRTPPNYVTQASKHALPHAEEVRSFTFYRKRSRTSFPRIYVSKQACRDENVVSLFIFPYNNIYKTLYFLCIEHCTTEKSKHRVTIYIYTVHRVPKFTSCQNAIMVVTRRAHCSILLYIYL